MWSEWGHVKLHTYAAYSSEIFSIKDDLFSIYLFFQCAVHENYT